MRFSELDPAAETALVRIVQEVLDNVAAHAQARRVRMRLDVAEGKTVLTSATMASASMPPPTAKGVTPRRTAAHAGDRRGGARYAAYRIASPLRHGDYGPGSGVAGYCQARLSTVFSYVAPGATSPHPSVHS